MLARLLGIYRRLGKNALPAHLATGQWGEREAERFLNSRNYKTLGRRVAIGRHDEVDLITRSPDDVLVFVEVKTRGDERFGRPVAAVDRRKQRVLSRAARAYLKKLRPRPDYFRFDVVEVVGSPEGGLRDIRHIENAFSIMENKRIFW
ncbi:MAG TPA: YraN family protein [Kiritimatiellia bacterium]|nr:YraN family protein [Kiritimatiellia bacterium]HMO98964.1 YraN family protein [Kiritimatiellia bacterium]HMP96412.1 YraN family protein [Kiritimatiellia bacterium]